MTHLKPRSALSAAVFKILPTVALWIGALFMLLPLIWMISTSLKTNGQIWIIPMEWFPNPVTMENFKTVAERVAVPRLFFNSLFVATTTTILQILFASLAAFSFARIQYWGRDFIFLLFLGTMMIPSYVLIIPLYMIMDTMHLLDTYWALILPGVISAFSIFMLRQFFLSIPKDLDEAAYIDGATKLQIHMRIIMPLSKPALATLTIFVFMNQWNDFFWPLIAVSSESMRTLQLGLAYFQQANTTEWGALMAVSLIATLPVLIVFSFAQKWFIEGIAMTGIKG
jgi:multiple sugar transport system permease protein